VTLAERLRAALARNAGPAHDILEGDELSFGQRGGSVAAAVLVAITDRPAPGLILTQRPETMRKHPGQVAFPGGRVDAADADVIAAALREAEEEIGLPRATVDVLGTVAPYRTITDYCVTPVIGVIPPDLVLRPNDGEVAAIFEVPLAFVFDPANHNRRKIDWRESERHYYEMHWEGFRIWGATAAMIINLGRHLAWVT
jgi:8-oxo-dGTP pyrophosphatase MutT (NUDIX family)